MNKRIGFLGIIIFFILALVGFYVYLKKQQETVVSALKAVPTNAALILDIKKPEKFLSQINGNNQFSNNILKFKELEKIKQSVIFLDSVFAYNLISRELLDDKKLVLSVHEVGNKSYKPLLLFIYKNRFEANQITKALEQLLISRGSVTFKRYNQARIFHFQSKNDKAINFYYTLHKGLFILGDSEILVQDALRQSDAENGLLQNEKFSELIKTAGDFVDANVYIQFKEIKKLSENFINAILYKNNGFNQYADWGVLDVNLKKSTLLLNGYSGSIVKNGQISKVFNGQNPQNVKFVKFISNTPEAFSILGISDIKLFRQNLADYMEDLGQKDRFDINEQSIRNAFGNHAVNDIENIVNNELACVTLSNGANLFAMQTTGYRNATELLKKLITYYAKSTNGNVSDYKKTYKIDNDSEFDIYEMPLKKFPTRMFGPWFNSCTGNFIGVFDNYILLSDNYKDLTSFIYNNVLQKTIIYNASYKEFENFLSNKVNFYQFYNLTGTGAYLEKWLSKSSNAFAVRNQEHLKSFYGVAFQFSTDNNLLYNNLLIRYQPVKTIQASTQWESKLDTLISFKPAILKNHYTGEKEIFVQDKKNTIYLLNKSGRILWKKKLNEPILSEIYQVDYFKNGKLQILFNTKSELHLLDRNSNYVERYPISFPVNTKVSLALFDYENRKNYRIFVPCINKKVYCYNIEGKLVTGFKFLGTDYEVEKPVQYFRNNNKDYLVISDKKRTYLLDRKGNERVKLKDQFESSSHNNFSFQKATSGKNARLVTTNKEGKIVFVYFNGEVETLEMNTFSENHFFAVHDLNLDGSDEFIFIDENKLYAYSGNGKKYFDYKFSSSIIQEPSFYKFSSKDVGIGVTEFNKSQIHLINNKGELYEGFPLKGKTRFSISLMNKGSSTFNLIVGGDDFYIYNYKLN